MNLVLTHCAKEWRSQRALLVAFTLLAFVTLCLGFLLLPTAWWRADGNRAFALACFVAAGVVGVAGFAAPQLVRGEFGPKGDQFVRRLPGALSVSFGGKLLFLVLVAAALPLLGLLGGELFLKSIGQPWDDVFRWYPDGTTSLVPPWPVTWSGFALLLAPWVWAAGTTLPGGRMAVGGAVLLVLLVGLGVMPVLRQYPNLERGVPWTRWLWAVAPFGLVVAGVAWVRGRRGGGAGRSARLAFAATLLGLVPPGLWLGAAAWRYRHPDPQALATIDVQGLSPDLRFALVRGNEHEDWQHATFRVDLQAGTAEQVHDLDSVLVAEGDRNGVRATRYWRLLSGTHLVQWWFDLTTGERTPLVLDAKGKPILTDEQRRSVADEARERTPFRAPGNRPVWLDGEDLCVETEAGAVVREAVGGRVFVRAKGHGLVVSSPTQAPRLFDPTTRTWMPEAADITGFLVRDILVSRKTVAWNWQRQRAGMAPAACDLLRGSHVLGLLDDDQLLCERPLPSRQWRLFVYHVASHTATELDVEPGNYFLALHPLAGACASLLPRDPAGRVWMLDQRGRTTRVLVLDVATHRATALPEVPFGNGTHLLAWPDDRSVLLATSPGRTITSDGAQIERIDLATGLRTILFPRPRATR